MSTAIVKIIAILKFQKSHFISFHSFFPQDFPCDEEEMTSCYWLIFNFILLLSLLLIVRGFHVTFNGLNSYAQERSPTHTLFKSPFKTVRRPSAANRGLRQLLWGSRSPSVATLTEPLSTTAAYGSDSITVLKGLEPVRLRPGMYIGSTGSRGLHHLVYEVVDNSVDEALAGHCTSINITLLEDGKVSVEDDGRGIPCDIHPSTGTSSLETVLCVLHAGGKFGGEKSGYAVSGGLHGVGISVVNALSESLSAEVYGNGMRHFMSFARGLPAGPLQSEPLPTDEAHKRGTRITFKPDKSIFRTDTVFDEKILMKRFDELAYLNPGLRFQLIDQREGRDKAGSYSNTYTFMHEGGISELLQELCKDKRSLHAKVPVITIHHHQQHQPHQHHRFANENTKGPKVSVSVDVALQWSQDAFHVDNILSFVNNINTFDGGTHVDGLRASITKIINQFAKKVTILLGET